MNIIPVPLSVKLLGGNSKAETINTALDDTLGEEEYTLRLENGVAELIGGSEKALFYAKQTLAQLCPDGGEGECCLIHDKPRFTYRGFMVDSARHYQSLEELKKIIDAAARLKLNVFHWHLTEDQGWRIESESHPELNAAAVRKCSRFGKAHSDEPYGIYYTKAQMREVVEYCAQRYIDVVPEVDMPGHTSAFLSALPQASCFPEEKTEVKTMQGIYENAICPAKGVGEALMKDVLDELTELFPFSVYHLGGDEVKDDHWSRCPDCQAKMKELGITSYADYENYFLSRMAAHLEEKGKRCIIWNDAAKGSGLNKSTMILQYWKEKDKPTVDYANDGGKVILSPFSYYYFDYDYDITSLRRALSFRPELKGMTEEGKGNILGLEAPIWTEYINSDKRLEELLFPRLLATACTAWQNKTLSYDAFLKTAAPMIDALKRDGYTFKDEKHWGYTTATTPLGWMRFVRDNYSSSYILGKKD